MRAVASGATTRQRIADRTGKPIEVDIVAPLTDGAMLTGAVKFSNAPTQPAVFLRHVDAVQRAAGAGLKWARQAQGNGQLLFLSAAGFTERFVNMAQAHSQPVLMWSLKDVYSDS